MANNESLAKHEENEEIVTGVQPFLREDTAALCFIAPYIPEKISPTKSIGASVDIIEELKIEDAVTAIKDKNIDKLNLLINSPGGGVSSSYKIAYCLRKNFKEINVFVPHIAASGGTLITLTGNKIIMGDMSNLTPIDVQLERKGVVCSVNAMIRSFHNLRELFKKKHESDIEYPVKALADKLDPVELQEWMDKSDLMEKHAKEIMNNSNSSLKDRSDKIISWLASGCPTHSYSIMFEQAKKQIGEDIVYHYSEVGDYEKMWDIMRQWLREYVLKESSTHFVSYILPEDKKAEPKDINTTKPINYDRGDFDG